MLKHKGSEENIDLVRIVDSLKKAAGLIGNLRTIRERFGFKKSEGRSACGVSAQCWSDWEAGRYAPRLTTTILLLNFLKTKQEILRLAKQFSQQEIQKQRAAELAEQAEWDRSHAEIVREDAEWYFIHREELPELKPEGYAVEVKAIIDELDRKQAKAFAIDVGAEPEEPEDTGTEKKPTSSPDAMDYF